VDAERRLWKRTAQPLTHRSRKYSAGEGRSGHISLEIPRSIQSLIEAEISRMPTHGERVNVAA